MSKKEPQKPAAQPKAQPAKAEAAIYVGPALPGLLSANTIFKGGELLPHVAELVEQQPAVRALIVPVSQLAEVYKRLADPASVEALRYKEAKTINRKGAAQ